MSLAMKGLQHSSCRGCLTRGNREQSIFWQRPLMTETLLILVYFGTLKQGNENITWITDVYTCIYTYTHPHTHTHKHHTLILHTLLLIILSCLSCSLVDFWGTTVDFTTNFLHSLRFSAFRSMRFHSRPVHYLMLSSHRFLCLPLHLPPWTVPCRIVLASLDGRVTCPYHFSLRLFTAVRRSS